jgi:hypothetical protein
MSTGRRIFKLFAYPGIIMAGHSGYVVYKRNQSLQVVVEQKSNPLASDFRTGTIDDRMMDTLRTGDLVLFQRRWYYHHLPIGLTILLYRYLFNTEFDHVGVIVMDRKGNVGILENTFFNGLQLRNFPDRITYSQSRVINVIPLAPRERVNRAQDLINAGTDLMAVTNGEWTDMLLACIEKIKVKYFDMGEKDKKALLCPNLQLLSKIYYYLGLQIDSKKPAADLRNFSLQQLSDRTIRLDNIDEKNGKVKISLSFEDHLVRTR